MGPTNLHLLRYIHSPYVVPSTGPATMPQPFDHTRVYRILFEDGYGGYSDVSTPVFRTDKKAVTQHNVVRLFYVGAEADMDRHLRWLRTVSLKTKSSSNDKREIYVIEQDIRDFLDDPTIKRFRASIEILFPNQLDAVDMLTDVVELTKRKVPHIF